MVKKWEHQKIRLRVGRKIRKRDLRHAVEAGPRTRNDRGRPLRPATRRSRSSRVTLGGLERSVASDMSLPPEMIRAGSARLLKMLLTGCARSSGPKTRQVAVKSRRLPHTGRQRATRRPHRNSSRKAKDAMAKIGLSRGFPTSRLDRITPRAEAHDRRVDAAQRGLDRRRRRDSPKTQDSDHQKATTAENREEQKRRSSTADRQRRDRQRCEYSGSRTACAGRSPRNASFPIIQTERPRARSSGSTTCPPPKTSDPRGRTYQTA